MSDGPPKKVTHKTGKAKRSAHIDVRMTEKQKAAIIRKARKTSLDPSTWMRSLALEQTDWDPDDDADFDVQSGAVAGRPSMRLVKTDQEPPTSPDDGAD